MIELIKISDTLLNDLAALVVAEPDALKRQTMQLAYDNLYHVRHFFRHLINLGQLNHETTVTLCAMTDDPYPSHSVLAHKRPDSFQLSARVLETAKQDDEALKKGLMVLMQERPAVAMMLVNEQDAPGMIDTLYQDGVIEDEVRQRLLLRDRNQIVIRARQIMTNLIIPIDRD